MGLAQKMAAVSFLCAQCGLCGATGGCGVHSWVRALATSQHPCPPRLPAGAEGHLSLGPGSKLLGSWESWALVSLLLLIGSATWVGHYPSLASVYPIVK